MPDKRKAATKDDDDRVTVFACAGFKHDGRYIRSGETVEVSAQDAADLAALNMARPLRPAGFVPRDGKRARG